MFYNLHALCNGLITLLRTNKILAMDHDPAMGKKGICLLEGGPRNPRCGGGGENYTSVGYTDLIIALKSN